MKILKTKIIIIGSGGHAKSCLEVIESTNLYEIVGLVDKNASSGSIKYGYKILGGDDDLLKLINLTDKVFMGIGGIKNLAYREELTSKITKIGFVFERIISPYATLSKTSSIGIGSIIHHNTYIGADVKIGNNCIINTGAILEHESQVGSHSHVSTGAILNGNVTVGERTFIGSGVIIKQGVKIGSDSLVNMGTRVFEDVGDSKTIMESRK